MQRQLNLRSGSRKLLALGALGVGALYASDARAQVSGTSKRPLPDVMLLLDNSGSMEFLPNGTKPICSPGVENPPNRWGMVLQALTGNVHPYYSCKELTRSDPSFRDRYSISGKPPYDAGYALKHYKPTSGDAAGTACVVAPWKIPGGAAGAGAIGVAGVGDGTDASAYPYSDQALASVLLDNWPTTGLPAAGAGSHACTFEQGSDGQLDVATNYARFGLMMFDNDTSAGTGLSGTGINTGNPFDGLWSYYGSASATGNPSVPGCLPTPQEIGARNFGAPPWEGRLMPFPKPDVTLYELAKHNEQVQNVILASRPYGATPIDGMLDDARNFLWNDAKGPKNDPYSCRERYIIILTDGAPNLDLRPQCSPEPPGKCPYDTGKNIVDSMYTSTDEKKKATTYVIGFSVRGEASTSVVAPNDGFPLTQATPEEKTCKGWFDKATSSATGELAKAQAMNAACSPLPPAGSTANACCKLNEIALFGSGTGAFFAESQADIVLSFGRIMARIIHDASTKTVPAFSSAQAFTADAFATTATATTTASAAQFIGSFIPSAHRPWSGELDRTRYLCDGSLQSVPVTPQDRDKGDLQSENVAAQAKGQKRTFLSVLPEEISSKVDASATIRPYANPGTNTSTGPDEIGKPDGAIGGTYGGTEVALLNNNTFDTTKWPAAMEITPTTCRRGRAVQRKGGTAPYSGTLDMPALTDPAQCTAAIWGFATAHPGKIEYTVGSTTFDYNLRCNGASTDQGTCSITATKTCDPAAANACPTGEACVPTCAALGAIYHSNPAVVPPPSSLLREDGFRDYQANRGFGANRRKTVIYTATADGVLHAFDAMSEQVPSITSQHELWAFVPPAVLPRLSTNYPGGSQILLDGTPVVRETVWDRYTGSPLPNAARHWHSTLVAGLGTAGGYYALNVTDPQCANNDCSQGTFPVATTAAHAATSGDTSDAGAKRGPHFLWQLTDIPIGATDDAKGRATRTSKISGRKMAALFGRNTSTPAVTTVIINSGGVNHEVGVAILPGGYDTPPSSTQTCPRKGTYPSGSGIRSQVRLWGKSAPAANPCDNPVVGRGVTVVRLDNGEIIKHFGRKAQDVPDRVALNDTIDTPFDSPMVGTPVVYPDQVGVPAQRAFIGDADGALWRLDFTSSDTTKWSASLFADLIPAAAGAAGSQPIIVPPVLSTDEANNVIVHAATGDQENIVYNPATTNYLYAFREGRQAGSATIPTATTLWYETLTFAERVTGPMTVFDRVLYFATYKPTDPSTGTCADVGTAFVWGLNYTQPESATNLALGGKPEWCDEAGGLCAGSTARTEKAPQGADLIPGVTLTASQACVKDGAQDVYGNGAFQNVTQTSYSISFGIARPGGLGGSNNSQASRKNLTRPLPRTPTRIDSWSLVLE